MKSIFDKNDNDEIISRIDNLSAKANPIWGKMSVGQMLAHCQVPIQITCGELDLQRGIAGYLFGNMAKKKLLSDKPFNKNLPTFKQARISESRDFNTEKALLKNYVSRLAVAGADGVTKRPHPFFGPLALHEWDALNYKHLDHHLQQFGV